VEVEEVVEHVIGMLEEEPEVIELHFQVEQN
jgi:hypothetical protein